MLMYFAYSFGKAMEYYREATEKFSLLKYKQLAFEKVRRIEQILKTQTAECTAVISHDALYIVNCTRIKIGDLDPRAPPFVPAIIAYQGSSFKKFLKYVEREGIKWWLILSAKYGFIEPWHPIENYDVSFDKEETGPITDKSLRNQVLHQTRWNYAGNPRRLRDFKIVYVYTSNNVYLEKVKKAFMDIAKVEQLQSI